MITSTANKDIIKVHLMNMTIKIPKKLCQNVIQSDWDKLQSFLMDLDMIISRVSNTIYYSNTIAIQIIRCMSNIYNDGCNNDLKKTQYAVSLLLDRISLNRYLYINMNGREEIFRLINMSIFIYLLHNLHIDTSVIFSDEKELEEVIKVNTHLILNHSDMLIREQDSDETKKLILGLLSKLQSDTSILLNKYYIRNIQLWIVKLRDYSEYKTFTSFKNMFISFRETV